MDDTTTAPKPPNVGDRMLACLGAPGLTGSEARVLATLAYHDGNGGCWISDARLARESGVKHASSARTARNGLRAKGWLRWRHGKNTNVYELAYGRPFESDSEPHPPGNSASENAAHTRRETRRLKKATLAGKLGDEPE